MDKYNEFNNEPRIRLISKDNTLVKMISQIQAFRLLKNGFATLAMIKPPSVQLLIEAKDWDDKFLRKTKHISSKWLRENPVWQTARRSVLYGNYHVHHPDGHVMFHCDATKTLWYLNRDIADIVSQDPPIIQLKFIPDGPGHIGDPYYLAPKLNQCVCCGSRVDLNRHHVLPRVFRRFLPEKHKNHNYHDVLLLCLNCHCKYEHLAGQLKIEICKEFGLTMNETGQIFDYELAKVTKSARAIINHGDVIPEPKRSEIIQVIIDSIGHYPSEEEIKILADRNPWKIGAENQHYGCIVANKVVETDTLQEFTERWRQHFIDSMNPQFMPELWDLNKPASDKSLVIK